MSSVFWSQTLSLQDIIKMSERIIFLFKNSGKWLIPREQPNQNKEIKIEDSGFMKDNEKCNISHAPYHPA